MWLNVNGSRLPPVCFEVINQGKVRFNWWHFQSTIQLVKIERDRSLASPHGALWPWESSPLLGWAWGIEWRVPAG